MDKQAQATGEMEKVAALIKQATIAMMTTLEPDGSMRSRPMATLQMDSAGQLWFFTSISSPKSEEIEQHRKVNLSYANLGAQDYVSISGTAELVQDRAKMRELWSAWVSPWFPGGVEDPDLALLKVTPEEAEYWDSPNSKPRRLLGLAKAMTTGRPGRSLGTNQKVTPPRQTH